MTQNTADTNTLPKEFISHLSDAFGEAFHAWARANNLPKAIIDGVSSVLYIAECGQTTMRVHDAGEHIANIANAIVLMGGTLHTGGTSIPARPMLMLATEDAREKAGHNSDLIDKFISEEVTA